MNRERLTAGVSRGSIALLAALAYLPALLTKPGRMPADTKLYLYLDPARLVRDAPSTWDTRQFGGWVPHQTIAYLWPQGPWYWTFEKLGVPDWVAHRLWIGTLLFLGAWGVLWAGRMLGLNRAGALAAAVVYQLSPYILPYVSRTSAMLLPWAGVGWLVGLTIKSATSEHRWRFPALMALVLLSCSAVNATAVMMIAPAPILWLVHAVWQGTVPWRRAVSSAARIGVLAMGVSLWWIAMLRAQGTYGADVLAYSESLQATSLTSVSTETLRGLGYWLFYVRDPYAFTTTASQAYMESGVAIAISFGVVLVSMLGLAVTRWSQRRYAALLVFAGIVLAVGVHPIDNASPLMTPLAEHSRSSLSLAIRSSTRALPMSNLGLALGAGALVTALGATRFRLRALAPLAVVLLAVLNLPALFDGGLVDPALERDQSPPAAWQQAADALSSTSAEYRVLQLPGSEFGAFRWGYTVDPPLPGMTTKPLVTRDLLPLGSPGVMDLLDALDDRVQSRTIDPQAIAAVSRLLGVDTVWVANDLAFDRFRTPRPNWAASLFTTAPGLGSAVSYGVPYVNVPDIPMVDEHALASPETALAPVELVPVEQPVPIVRASDRVVVLVGSGDGAIDAAAAGLLTGDEALLYAADLHGADTHLAPALVILTDSNRDRAHHWRSSQDVIGFTESGGAEGGVLRPDEADQRLPVFGLEPDPSDQTTATLDGGLTVRASSYGEPFAYRPEQRPAMAVDGDPSTAWVVGDRTDPVGEFITASSTNGTLTLLQPPHSDATRRITTVRITTATASAPIDVTLDDSSLVEPGQAMQLPDSGPVTVTITGVGPRAGGTDTGASAVGFAELGLGTHTEVVHMPSFDAGDAPLAVVMTRLRTDPMNRWRSDPEPTLVRSFDLAGDHSFTATVTLHRDDRADDTVLDALGGMSGPVADRRATGDPAARGIFAADGDLTTAWTSPFTDVIGSQLTFAQRGPVESITLVQPTDGMHSTITGLRLQSEGGPVDVQVPTPDGAGRSVVTLASALSGDRLTVTVTAIDPRTTIDRRFAETTTLPVALREVIADGLVPTAADDTADASTCDQGFVTLDGTPLPVAFDQSTRDRLDAGESVDVPLCDATPLRLTNGSHRIESSPGLESGVDVDRISLTDITPRSAAPPPAVTVTRTRTTRTATVAACPTGCWLIMGEGFNAGWSASIDGGSLGSPTPIAGGFNGWWLAPSDVPTVVHIDWTAQTPVTVALVVSLIAAIGCVVVASWRRKRTIAWHAEPPRLTRTSWNAADRRSAVIAASVLVAFAFLVAGPSTAAIALVPAAVVVATRRPRLAAVGGVLLMAALAARVLQRQIAGRYAANAGWPGLWEKLHRPGMLVIVLLLASALVGGRDDDAPPTEPTPLP